MFSVDNAAALAALAAANAGTAPANEETVPAISWPPETFEASGDEDSLMGLTNNGYDIVFYQHKTIFSGPYKCMIPKRSLCILPSPS